MFSWNNYKTKKKQIEAIKNFMIHTLTKDVR